VREGIHARNEDMLADRQEWADAYAQQSASDFEVYEILAGEPSIPTCHRMHYLQMTCEKIAKAYMFRDTKASGTRLVTSHAVFSKFMGNYIASPAVKAQYQGREAQLRSVGTALRALAREVEKLAPAVDSENSPSNAEYPWESDGKVIIPCLYAYPNLSLLRTPSGFYFLKLIKEAIVDFEKQVIR